MKFKLLIVFMLFSMTGFAADRSYIGQKTHDVMEIKAQLRSCGSFDACRPYVIEALKLGLSPEEIKAELKKKTIEETANEILNHVFNKTTSNDKFDLDAFEKELDEIFRKSHQDFIEGPTYKKFRQDLEETLQKIRVK
ncbi:MAG: hypothetical protein HYW47_02135 [Deltaproteobacteria bacterium]|nr:hypothetical protein [Deltaproteobacteria bacterium]